MSDSVQKFQERFRPYSKCFLYGATPAAEGALKLLQTLDVEVLAFVDRDTAKQAKPFHGYPVLAPQDYFKKYAPSEAATIIVSAYQCEIFNFLITNGVSKESIFPHLDGMFYPTYGPYYINDNILDQVDEQLEDEEEKVYFASWRTFKETGCYADLKPMKSIKKQYEQSAWMKTIRSRGVCLDVGAYDGSSSLEFYETGLFEKVIALEPFKQNFKMLEAAVSSGDMQQKIEGRMIALGARRETFYQQEEGVSSRARIHGTSAIEKTGDKIEVYALDDLNLSNLSMVKVDIEGFEPEFLTGSLDTLRREAPHLAISAYHDAAHAALIPQFMKQNFDNVKIRIGHHPQAVYELEYYISFNKMASV